MRRKTSKNQWIINGPDRWFSWNWAEPIHLEPKGGGGTDFRPVFEWVEANQIAPACVIYLTDLCCHSYPPIPEYPVLWVTDSLREAPLGETVRICLD